MRGAGKNTHSLDPEALGCEQLARVGNQRINAA